MNKETRANLIFVAILLALVIPGGVFVFKKRLKSGRPVMMMGEAVRTQLPYMAEMEAPNMQRISPPLTEKFVRSVAASHGVERLEPPVMSMDRRVELLGTGLDKGDAKGAFWGILLWDPTAIVSEKTDVSVSAGSVVDVETIALPEEVSQELAYNGIVRVPHRVIWLKVENPDGKPLQLVYHTRDGEERQSVIAARK